DWDTRRGSRNSAWLAPADSAAESAASANACRGSDENSSSIGCAPLTCATLAELLPSEADHHHDDDDEQHDAHEPGAAAQRHPRPDDLSGDVEHRHRRAEPPQHVPGGGEVHERTEVRSGVDHL